MDEKEPTQPSQPMGRPGEPKPDPIDIPVPKRSAWDRLLRKVSQPKPPNGEARPKPSE